MYVLKLQGQDESVEELVNGIGKELEDEGATLEQIDRIGKQEFAYQNYAKQNHGYYVRFHFEVEPEKIDSMRTKMALNKEIMLQHYQRK